MTRKQISQKIQSNQSIEKSTMEWMEILVDEIFADRQEYDLKVKSDEHGYLSGLSWFGRVKPNTTYKVYIEEEK